MIANLNVINEQDLVFRIPKNLALGVEDQIPRFDSCRGHRAQGG